MWGIGLGMVGRGNLGKPLPGQAAKLDGVRCVATCAGQQMARGPSRTGHAADRSSEFDPADDARYL